MATLTMELRQLLQQGGGEPLRLIDPETNREYVLVLFDQLQALQSDLAPRDFYPALHRPCRMRVGTTLRWTSITGMASRGEIVVVDFAVAGMPKRCVPFW
jgi:hypothetical protein